MDINWIRNVIRRCRWWVLFVIRFCYGEWYYLYVGFPPQRLSEIAPQNDTCAYRACHLLQGIHHFLLCPLQWFWIYVTRIDTGNERTDIQTHVLKAWESISYACFGEGNSLWLDCQCTYCTHLDPGSVFPVYDWENQVYGIWQKKETDVASTDNSFLCVSNSGCTYHLGWR